MQALKASGNGLAQLNLSETRLSVDPERDIASMMKVETSVSPDRSGLNVAIAYTWAPFFAHTFDGKVLPIRVSAKAVLASQALADALEIHLEGPSLPLLNHLHLFGNAMSSVGKGVLKAAAKDPTYLRKLHEKDLKKNSRPVGVAKNPRTLVPRPGVKGEEAYTPTLWIGKNK